MKHSKNRVLYGDDAKAEQVTAKSTVSGQFTIHGKIGEIKYLTGPSSVAVVADIDTSCDEKRHYRIVLEEIE